MLRLVLIGLVAGSSSSLFGVGGGIVIVPLLILLAASAPKEATATSLGAIVITALAGVTLYALRGKVDVAYAALVGIPAMAVLCRHSSAAAGSPGRALTIGVRRVARGDRHLAARRMSTTTIVLAVCLGLAAGVLSGLFGVGGGILFVPTARRARPRPGRGRSDVAARDRAHGRRRRRGARRATATCACDPPSSSASRRSSGSRQVCRSRPPFPSTSCGASSASCSSPSPRSSRGAPPACARATLKRGETRHLFSRCRCWSPSSARSRPPRRSSPRPAPPR